MSGLTELCMAQTELIERMRAGEYEYKPAGRVVPAVADPSLMVGQLDPDTRELVAVFPSANAAARAFGREGRDAGASIREAICTRGLRYGYRWIRGVEDII
ncbi:hypothetical protein [Bifidobacterium eulemuris]|uniref:Uncharacterized protein n=1 Tax=Bifidobacterium eulemuris TaxID=1765219 RepID=A0A261G9W7_9BIFI|nr:hypothetical protein [Bifidobacterium eulemuris]OZG68227.1 hypothetical protein BEUL_1240 [Bifidobacterium eulemuris]QOL31716.1 hypothetical protein BE0216_03990 [Bifidobacterium eulemuris]